MRQRSGWNDGHPLDVVNVETGKLLLEALLVETRRDDPLRRETPNLGHRLGCRPRLDQQQRSVKPACRQREDRLGIIGKRQANFVGAVVERTRDLDAAEHCISGVDGQVVRRVPRGAVAHGRSGRQLIGVIGRSGGGTGRLGGCHGSRARLARSGRLLRLLRLPTTERARAHGKGNNGEHHRYSTTIAKTQASSAPKSRTDGCCQHRAIGDQSGALAVGRQRSGHARRN